MEQNQECCPQFNPTGWDNKTYHWENKLFVQETIPQFFHMPLDWMFGKAVSKMMGLMQKENAMPTGDEGIFLTHEPNMFKLELDVATTKEVAGLKNIKISGDFICKVFDGEYSQFPNWIKQTKDYVASQNKVVKDFYFYYTVCPKCAKKWGHNYVVIFAQV